MPAYFSSVIRIASVWSTMVIPRSLIDRLYAVYAVATLIMSTGAFQSLFIDFGSPGQTSEGSPVLKLFWATVYAITALRVLTRTNAIGAALKANRALVALVALALLSTLWSIDSVFTLHQATSVAFGFLFAADLSISYSLKRQLQIVCAALLIVVSLSVVVQICAPDFIPGSDLEGSAWHGVFGRKNEFGRIVCFGATAVSTLVFRSRWKMLLLIAGSSALALLSRSVSALIYLLIMIAITRTWSLAFVRPNMRKLAIAGLSCLVLIGATLMYRNFSQITEMMGKDPHMTGRSDLWSNALLAVRNRPLLGYGFQAFWGVDSQPARVVREAAGWEDAPHAHNGYIDLALSLGAVGLLTYLLACVSSIRRARQHLISSVEPERRWPLSCLVLLLIYQVTEATIISGNTFFWLVFCSLAISLSLEEGTVPLPAWKTRHTSDPVYPHSSLKPTY